MLRRRIVPYRHVAGTPAPTHGVFGALDIGSQRAEHRTRFGCPPVFDAGDEVAEEQARRSRDRVQPRDSMIGAKRLAVDEALGMAGGGGSANPGRDPAKS